jgi:hypothetical protein
VPVRVRRFTPETCVAAFVTTASAVMLAGYPLDLIGVTMSPALLGVQNRRPGSDPSFPLCRGK